MKSQAAHTHNPSNMRKNHLQEKVISQSWQTGIHLNVITSMLGKSRHMDIWAGGDRNNKLALVGENINKPK